MANQAEKRRLEANERRLGRLRLAIIVANVAYIVGRFVLQRSSVFWFNIVACILANGVYLGCYLFLVAAAKPVYSDSKELKSAGADLSMSGVLEYVNDGIILTAIVQILGSMTDWAWLLALVAPGYAAIVGWSYIRAFMAAQSKQMDEMRSQDGRHQRRRTPKRRRE